MPTTIMTIERIIARTLFTCRAKGLAPSPAWDQQPAPHPLQAECVDDAKEVARVLRLAIASIKETHRP
jgi:hypothetical protein